MTSRCRARCPTSRRGWAVAMNDDDAYRWRTTGDFDLEWAVDARVGPTNGRRYLIGSARTVR